MGLIAPISIKTIGRNWGTLFCIAGQENLHPIGSLTSMAEESWILSQSRQGW